MPAEAGLFEPSGPVVEHYGDTPPPEATESAESIRRRAVAFLKEIGDSYGNRLLIEALTPLIIADAGLRIELGSGGRIGAGRVVAAKLGYLRMRVFQEIDQQRIKDAT
jgi:hypothetical protein